MSKKSLGSGLIYLVTNIINAAVPFILLPILTRVLTPFDYGIITMFSLVVTLMGAFTGLNTHGAVSVRFFKMSKIELSQYIYSTFIILVTSSFIIALVICFDEILTKFTLLPKEWLLIACLVSSCQFMINIKLALWQVRQEAIKYGVFRIAQTILNGLLSILLIYAVGASWEGRTFGISIAVFVFSLIAVFLLFKNNDMSIRVNKKHINDALRFGVPLIPHTIGGVAIVMIDRLLLANMLGEESVGVYMVAMQVAMVLAILADAFVKAYGPWLYKALNTPENKLYIVGVTYIVFIAFLLTIFPTYYFLDIIFIYLVGEEFTEAVELIIWFLIGNAFIGMYYAVAGFYFFSNKTYYISFITFSVGVLSAGLTYSFIIIWGLKGAAYAFAISNIFMFTLALFFSSKVIKLPWNNIKGAFHSVIENKYVN